MLSDKIADKKVDYDVFSYEVKEDRYGNESYGYSDTPDKTVHCVFTPVSSEVDIAEYGERVNEMRQAVILSDVLLNEKDRVAIDGNKYTIVSIRTFPSYRLILAERVQ